MVTEACGDVRCWKEARSGGQSRWAAPTMEVGCSLPLISLGQWSFRDALFVVPDSRMSWVVWKKKEVDDATISYITQRQGAGHYVAEEVGGVSAISASDHRHASVAGSEICAASRIVLFLHRRCVHLNPLRPGSSQHRMKFTAHRHK